jgi:YegS/Rv2252/BmrU family lipid kinase
LARRLAPRTDIIVAVGGDGTINEVVNGMAQAAEPEQVGEDRRPACRLGIVPAGTVNVVALELKLPFKAEDACRVIAGGHTRALDLGKVNDRRFVLMTGAGIDALTIQHLDPRLKKRLRSLAFVGTGLTEGLSHQQPEFVVTIDGAQYRATFFVASNFRYYAGHLAMAPKADPADGLLDMMLFHGTTKQSLLTFWWRLLARTHVRWRNVTCVQAARAELSPLSEEEPVWLQADGEIVGKLPAVVEIEPAAIEVLVP